MSEYSLEYLLSLADVYADIISIRTNSWWCGSYSDINKAKNLTSKPILVKGLHLRDEEVSEAFYHGADYVLVVGLSGTHMSSDLNNILDLIGIFPTEKKIFRELKTDTDIKDFCDNLPKDVRKKLYKYLWTLGERI